MNEYDQTPMNTTGTDVAPRVEICHDMIQEMMENGASLKQLSELSGVNYLTMSALKNRRNASISNKTFSRLETVYVRYKNEGVDWKAAAPKRAAKKAAAATDSPAGAGTQGAQTATAPSRRGRKAAAAPEAAGDFQLPVVTDAQIAALEREISQKQLQLEYLKAIRDIQQRFKTVPF